MTVCSFTKCERLLDRHDFLRLREEGKKISTPHFLFQVGLNGSSITRIGITVSRKVGNAVIRNRLKRYIREIYRQNKILFKPKYYNIIVKRGAERLDYNLVAQEILDALGRMIG